MDKKSSNKSKTNSKKNRKGFTLVELIAVISIMAVVSTIAIATFVGVSRNVRQKEYESVVSSIQAGAMNFYEATNIKKFYVQTLID